MCDVGSFSRQVSTGNGCFYDPFHLTLVDELVRRWVDERAMRSTLVVVDRKEPTGGEKRMMRGGCWYCDTIHRRASRRNRDPQDHESSRIGFRIAASPRNER
jgi:formylglycine-generating enzyme required for sulfatase activity